MDGVKFPQVSLLENSYISSFGELSFGKWSAHQSRRWLVQFVSHFSPSPPPPTLIFFPFSRKLKKRAFCLLSWKVTLKFICALFICFHLCHSWAAVCYIGQSRWIPNLHSSSVLGKFHHHPPPLVFCAGPTKYYSFQFKYWDISGLCFSTCR